MWEEDYGLGRLWLAARDPHTLHASWDLTAQQAAAAGDRLALRVFGGREPSGAFREVALSPASHMVFVPVEPAGQWYVAVLGFRDPGGNWQELARSVPVRTPPEIGLEARPEEFVMLTLPPEAEPTAPPGPAVEPTAEAGGREAGALPPAPPVGPPSTPPGAVGAIAESAVVTAPEGIPAAPGVPVPSAVPPRETPPPVQVPPPAEGRLVGPAPVTAARLVAAPAPPWTRAQAREMATVLAGLVPGVGPSSGELAAEAPAGPAAWPLPPGPGSPGAAFGREQPPAEAPSSGALPAPPAPGVGGRFWFNINAELIVYGATEPDATVTVDGQRIALRPDGSFTLRFALPDGEYGLEAVATAAGGAEQRLARLRFARRTHYRGEVGQTAAEPGLQPPAPLPKPR